MCQSLRCFTHTQNGSIPSLCTELLIINQEVDFSCTEYPAQHIVCSELLHLLSPNQMHYLAIKQIGWYLYGTHMKRLILTPAPKNWLSTYVDSDFAFSWSKMTMHLHHSVLSHASFVIMYSCPIHWVSKHKSEIALSTCKAENIALSMCAQALIPLCLILDELSKWFFWLHSVDSLKNSKLTLPLVRWNQPSTRIMPLALR